LAHTYIPFEEYERYIADRRAFEASLHNVNLDLLSNKAQGRGIVTCAGGIRYIPCVWVLIYELRRLGCSLPIEVWHFKDEIPAFIMQHLAQSGVRFVEAEQMMTYHPHKHLHGWELKPYAITHSSFNDVLFIDADNCPVKNPEFLFDTPEYIESGSVFWPDLYSLEPERLIWKACEVDYILEPEFETGQILLDKSRCLPALALSNHLNENSDYYYQLIHGDKETFHMAWRRLKTHFFLVPHPTELLDRKVFLQFWSDGSLLFQHRNFSKWKLPIEENDHIEHFQNEDICLEHLSSLTEFLRDKELPSTKYTNKGYTLKGEDRNLMKLVEKLKEHQDIVAIVLAGSALDNPDANSEWDIMCLFSTVEVPFDAIMFSYNHYRVDMFLRSIAAFSDETPSDFFHLRLVHTGRIIFERDNILSNLLPEIGRHVELLSQVKDVTIDNDIHKHFAYITKVKEKLAKKPVEARYFIYRNLSRLIFSYARLRSLTFRGESRVLDYIQIHEPDLYAKIASLLFTNDIAQMVELSIEITEAVLEPVGGLPVDGAIVTIRSISDTVSSHDFLDWLNLDSSNKWSNNQ